MPLPTVEARPQGREIKMRAGTAYTEQYDWSEDPLAGRTFEATVEGLEDPLELTIDTDTDLMTIVYEVPDDFTDDRPEYVVTETTGGGDGEVMWGGRLLLSHRFSPTPSVSSPIKILRTGVSIPVTVLGARGPAGADGQDGADGADGADGLDGVAAATGLATYDEPTRTIDVAVSAVQALITAAIDDLIDGAPGALDTLNELAAAVNDDASFAAAVTSALANKAAIDGSNITPATWRTVLGLVIGTDVQAFAAYLSTLAAVGSHSALVTALRAAGLDAYLNGTYLRRALSRQTRRADVTESVLTTDGAWCWFNGPLVVDYEGTYRKRYAGWVKDGGDIVVGSWDLDTGVVETFTLASAFDDDDHAAPGILVRSDGRILVFYSPHGGAGYSRLSTNPEDISAFGAAVALDVGDITYPKPIRLGSRIFLFFRGGTGGLTTNMQQFVYSDDNGATWSAIKKLWHTTADSSAPPYVHVVERDGVAHFLASESHPSHALGATNRLYHFSFDGTTFEKTDGTAIYTLAALPSSGLALADATLVYNGTDNGKGWGWDVAADADGVPVVVFASFPSDTDHRYNYGRWDGAAWDVNQITPAGGKYGTAETGFTEVNYSGGIALDQDDPSIVFLSRQVDPSGQFEIERWVTSDGGTTWTSAPVTFESTAQQARPMTPRNPIPGTPEVLWMDGLYVDYHTFDTAIRSGAAAPLAQTRDALLARPLGAGLTDVLLAPAKALSPSLVLPLAADVLDVSSNEYVIDSAVTPTFGAGRYGDRKALTFDGTAQYLASRSYKPFQTGVVRTFFGWAYRTNSGAHHPIFAGSVGSGSNYPMLRLANGSNDVFFTANTASAGVTWSGAWPGNAVWAHWALIFDDAADTVELYVNGVSKGVQAHAVAFTNTNLLWVGHRIGSDYFNGRMALFGIYEGRLTAAQIANLAGAVSGSTESNPAMASLLSRLLAEGVIGADNTTAPVVDLFVRKTADETVTSSATLQDDDHLTLPVVADSTYMFRAVIAYDGATTGDLKFQFVGPAGSTVTWNQIGLSSAATSTSSTAPHQEGGVTAQLGSFGAVGAGTKASLLVMGLIRTAGTAGNLKLQWAQAASDGTATTLFTDSYLHAQKVA